MIKLILLLLSHSLWGRIIYKLTRIPLPYPLNTILYYIIFRILYKTSLSQLQLETEKPIRKYTCLNDFFIRKLKKNIREIDDSRVISPCDGKVFKQINVNLNNSEFRIKSIDYSLQKMINPESKIDLFRDDFYQGSTLIHIYLAPTNYHRVHHPTDSSITCISYISGRCLPVNKMGISFFPHVFNTNRRLVFIYQNGIIMVMISALNVGYMTVSGDNARNINQKMDKQPTESYIYDADNSINVLKGQEAGIFHLGSSVILIIPRLFNMNLENLKQRYSLRDNNIKLGNKLLI